MIAVASWSSVFHLQAILLVLIIHAARFLKSSFMSCQFLYCMKFYFSLSFSSLKPKYSTASYFTNIAYDSSPNITRTFRNRMSSIIEWIENYNKESVKGPNNGHGHPP
jgi:hypothetical protein